MSEELDIKSSEASEPCVHEYEPFYGIGSPKLEPEGLVCKKCNQFVETIIPPTKL